MLSENVSDWDWSRRGQELFYPDNFPKDETRQKYPKCPMECENGWVEDHWCDTECNLEECGKDGGDCAGWCGGECRPAWPGDGQCDANCYKEECKWDGGDCKEWKDKKYLAINPDKEAEFDYSNCKCDPKKLGNKKCNPECNTYECRLDGLDCLHECSEECPKMWTGDGSCDMECDNEFCFQDKGDCVTCSEGCRTWMQGNGVCDLECNNADCTFDHGDCDGVTKVLRVDYKAKPFAYEFCAEEFIGDGHCDEYCYNQESDWDQGDCKGTDFETQMTEKKVGPQFQPINETPPAAQAAIAPPGSRVSSRPVPVTETTSSTPPPSPQSIASSEPNLSPVLENPGEESLTSQMVDRENEETAEGVGQVDNEEINNVLPPPSERRLKDDL